jgi:hypothetical protein
MGNRRFYKIEYLHTLGTAGSDRLKVTALNLFHPTAFPPFQKVGFFILRHSLLGERERVGGRSWRCYGEGDHV